MMQEWTGDNRFKNLVSIVLVLAAIGIAAYTYLAFTQAKYMGGGIGTISVTGKSEMFVKPDIATFTYSVMAEAPDATTAQTKSADAVNAIMAYLKEQGVEEKDIKTSNYSLYPRYEYPAASCPQGWCPPERAPRLAGYTVDQSVTVKVRDLEKAGTLIAGVGGKGATNVSGLTFTIDDMDASKEQVREEAIADAKAKAERLAESLGVRLGKLVNYYEEQPYPYSYGYGGEVMAQKAMDASQASVPSVTPGENEVISNITLIYEIK